MKNYVFLKDSVVFACHTTDADLEPVNAQAVEVEENPESFMYKKYVDGEFLDAELIRYAIVDPNNNNTVVSIEKTYFPSDVKTENIIITDPNVKVLWVWNGQTFISPEQFNQNSNEEITAPLGFVPITEEQEEF
jgi:hypothetical protein